MGKHPALGEGMCRFELNGLGFGALSLVLGFANVPCVILAKRGRAILLGSSGSCAGSVMMSRYY